MYTWAADKKTLIINITATQLPSLYTQITKSLHVALSCTHCLIGADLHKDDSKICHFFANVIFIAFVGVILKPCRASLAEVDWLSLSNSTNAISCRPGTSRTSLKPGNLQQKQQYIICIKKGKASHTRYWALGPELIPVYRQSARNWF